jgi:antitoxin ParD1/3/4
LSIGKTCQFLLSERHGYDDYLLPDSLKGFVDEQVAERGYGTSSEYVRELIRKDQDRQHLRKLLREGASSPRAGPPDDAYFYRLHQRIAERAAKRA